jgi:acyl carrier protein
MSAETDNARALRDQLKSLLVEALRLEGVKPEDIGDSEALFAPDNRLGLDSLSALELLSAIEFKFDVVFPNDGSAKQHFESIATLAAFLDSTRG